MREQLNFRAGTHADLAEVDALRTAIGWGPGGWYIAPLLESTGTLILVRTPAGELVAMGAAGAFGAFGFVGNMVVHREWRSRGLGRQVFEQLMGWMTARGVRRVELEATEDGRPLYESLGFRPVWESVTGVLTRAVEAVPDPGVRAATPGDWDAIAALDCRAYGGDRSGFLRAWEASPRHREALVVAESGVVTAYGFRLDNRVGPVGAQTPEAAGRIARALLARGEAGTLVSIGVPTAAAVWTPIGVELEPYDLRMAWGDGPGPEPGLLYAMACGGTG